MAPSPTGFFHVGSARTALFNWLFAKHHKGKFILRVEDTDVERSSEEMIDVVLQGMEWLGMDRYEGPYFQSKRIDLYKEYIKKLLETGKAYYCYCDPQTLDKERKAAYARKEDWKYNRRCLSLSDADKEKKDQSNIPKAVRFLVPEQQVTYKDIVYGEISRDSKDIEDFIIQRANGMPTYNLACVVDDHDMGISHVIRGADHITNTPKQILLYEACDFAIPEFAHLPLILGPDKSKLSKRHGAVSLDEYKEKGFLSDAMVNYLALLSWSPGDDNEDFMDRKKPENLGTVDMIRLAKEFTLGRVNKANAIFDVTKLEWMNQQYIHQLNHDKFQELLKPFIIKHGLMTEEILIRDHQRYVEICNLMQPRLKILNDIDKQARFFFKEDFEYDKDTLNKYLNKKNLDIVKEFLVELQNIENFKAQAIESALRHFVDQNKIKARDLIHPLRAFTTGSAGGPPLFDTLELIGKQRCINRIKKMLKQKQESK